MVVKRDFKQRIRVYPNRVYTLIIMMEQTQSPIEQFFIPRNVECKFENYRLFVTLPKCTPYYILPRYKKR